MNWSIRGWSEYRGSRAEFKRAGICLAIGVFIVPALIWAVGRGVLGPYTNGGLLAMWRDFLLGLGAGSEPFWFIALGPYLFIWFLRLIRRLARRGR